MMETTNNAALSELHADLDDMRDSDGTLLTDDVMRALRAYDITDKSPRACAARLMLTGVDHHCESTGLPEHDAIVRIVEG